MGYKGRWEDMPENLEDLQDRIFEGYVAGIQRGRRDGGREVAGNIEDWVKNRYMSKEVKRKTTFSDEILSLARDLRQALKKELSEVDENPSETQSKQAELLRIELTEMGKLL